jgi:hypothetical protein
LLFSLGGEASLEAVAHQRKKKKEKRKEIRAPKPHHHRQSAVGFFCGPTRPSEGNKNKDGKS